MKKILKVFEIILEIITAPITMLIKSNGVAIESNKLSKPIAILLVALVIVALLVLWYYREYIFK